MQSILVQRGLRRSGTSLHRTVRFSRKYNGAPNAIPHTTYFQQPQEPPKPPRRIWRSILFGTTCIGLGAYAHSWLYDLPFLGLGIEVMDEGQLTPELALLEESMATAVQDAAARGVPPMDLDRCQEMLEARSGYSVTQKAVAHTAQLPSNLPCEDTWSSGAFTFFNDPAKDWCEWAIFDGHAGPRTSQILKELLPSVVGETLWGEKCLERPYTPNDRHILDTIKQTFSKLDSDIIATGLDLIRDGKAARSDIIAAAAPSFSGSCALLALYDPGKSVLRVANTGDSRAVLGRWDRMSGKYVAQPMSVDQTGFNQDEVARMDREHPGEDVIDPKTGRVHGIAVSRAFGDARWKWPNDISKRAHDLFWGPSPRPKGVIKTPPYLTAEPEVSETRVQSGDHPDFLIMASDGLWDNMSSEDAVACVQLWLDKNKPTNFLEKPKGGLLDSLGLGKGIPNPLARTPLGSAMPSYSSTSDVAGDEDTYFDEDEKCLKWRVSPKHFVNEDEHCGIHLVKNALGGKRRDLFTGIMSVQPPLSRYVRDDITVHVIFFGVDTQEMVKN